MLDAASYPALWQLSDATGVRPEWVLPVLYNESGFNPAASNAAGYPYYGLNQISGNWLAQHGVATGDYLRWPASEQLRTVVAPYLAQQIARYGALRSGTKVALANFYPAALATASSLASTVVCKPGRPCHTKDSDAYCANQALDLDHSGCITVGDMARWVRRAAMTPAVRSAIAAAYALRPREVQSDPALGYDFGPKAAPWQLPATRTVVSFLEGVVYASAATALVLNLPRLKRMVMA